ncbi:MAG TPA: hypothetical protein VGF98_10905 [Candidatus Tumulicola sp.]
MDWSVAVGGALVIVGVAQIVAVVLVGRWAWRSAMKQIDEVRTSNSSQQANYQAALTQANGQQQVNLAFAMLRQYHEKTTVSGITWSAAECSEHLMRLAESKKIASIKSDVGHYYSGQRSNVSDQGALTKAVSAAIIVNNYYIRAVALLKRKLIDEDLMMTLGDLAAGALPYAQAVSPPHIKTKAYEVFVARWNVISHPDKTNAG